MHLCVTLGRTTDQDGWPQTCLQFLNHAFHGRAGKRHQVHPIELAESPQLHLGGGNIHDSHGIPSSFIVGKRQHPADGCLELTRAGMDGDGITALYAQASRQLAIHKNRVRAQQRIQ